MDDISAILKQDGPQTGAQLAERTRMEVFALWKACRKTPGIRFEHIGQRFLRLDRVVQGYARLSPSIRREFLTYTLLGLESELGRLKDAADLLRRSIRQISQDKRDLAKESMAAAVSNLPESDAVLQKSCFIIAGDIVYQMSHTVPRPEKSSGEMVRGSDLDIIVVAADDLPLENIKALDKAIYRKKHFLLVHPEYREEVDYIVKGMQKVREQVKFDSFESMIACKILREGEFLYGSRALFQSVKDLLDEMGVLHKLDQLEQKAAIGRETAEKYLLDLPPGSPNSEFLHLFYTREEGDEIY
jgi:hypothetical protein